MTSYPNNPIIHEDPRIPRITLVFRVDREEEVQALHTFRGAFGAATDMEALDKNTFVSHIRPGICLCGGGAA